MLHQCAVLCNKLLQTILNCTKLHPTNQNVEVGLTGEHMKICDECETVAHCTKHGCIPKVSAKDSAMRLALEALKELVAQTEIGLFAVKHDHVAMQNARQAITALREALTEQPAQQEPVAWITKTGSVWKTKADETDTPLYTTPPQRTWVGLTIEEKRQLFDREDYQGWLDYINAIEAKLRSKNENSN
jgi:hypothetical protein